jgi:hypothetical protein
VALGAAKNSHTMRTNTSGASYSVIRPARSINNVFLTPEDAQQASLADDTINTVCVGTWLYILRIAHPHSQCRHIIGVSLSCRASPQLPAGEAGALGQGPELRPGDRRHHGGRPGEGREAAVDAGDDILAPH